MTDEQINQRIAEACGWKNITRSASNGWLHRRLIGTNQQMKVTFDVHTPIPDYCADLNAMHEAEKMLKGYEQIHTYVWHLNNRKDWETDFKLMEVHISARDRAEAFLRTLGKWEATTEESSVDGRNHNE